jgi:hexosaminidase
MTRLTILLAILLDCGLYGYAQEHHAFNLMPIPREVSAGSGEFKLDRDFSFHVQADPNDPVVWAAVNRGLQSLKKTTGLPLDQKAVAPASTAKQTKFSIVAHDATTFGLGDDESYSLTVTSTGVVLEAAQGMGVLRGMSTFAQLLQNDGQGFYLPVVTIHDAPRYAWRGLMIDVARHFEPIDVLKRNIDAMAMVKLNVLHLHLSDNEGFRVESKVFPKLQGDGSDGQYYSQDEIRDLIAYARMRGILIVPEFDMPSHSMSWLAGYPELSSSPGPFKPGSPPVGRITPSMTQAEMMAVFQSTPAPALDPTRESTYKFLDELIAEMAGLFPAPYFHIGADENNGVVWRNNPAIAAYIQAHHLADTQALQAYFVGRLQTIVEKHGKQMVAWEEAYTPSLAKTTIFQVWTPFATKDLTQTAADGTKLLDSKGLYLDWFFPAHVYYLNDSFLRVSPTRSGISLLGGEAAMWSEIEDRWTIESRIWPRAGAVAERLWSPVATQDVDDMYRRLFLFSESLDQAGIDNLVDYNRQVRRVAGDLPSEPVKTLLDVLTPVKGVSRLMKLATIDPSKRDSMGPLNRVTDVVMVDSQTKYRFRRAVADYLQTHSPESEAVLRKWLALWLANDALLQRYFAKSEDLREVRSQSANLACLARAGLTVLDSSKSGSSTSGLSSNGLGEIVKEAKVSHGETEIAILPEIDALIQGKLEPEPKVYPLF